MITILCALAAAAAGMQEKVTLKHQPRAGDSYTLNATVTMSVTVKQGGKELGFRGVNNRVATVEILEAADDRVTKKEIEVLSDTDEQTVEGRTERRESPVHGKRVTATRKDGKWEFACDDKVDAEALKKAGDDEKFTRLLPGREVAVGESWTLAGEKLNEAWALAGGLDGEMKMTLKEVKEIDGKRCAVVSMKWDVRSPKGTDGTWQLLRLEGELVAAVDRGYIVSILVSGPIAVRRGDDMEVASGSVTYMFAQSVTEK